MVLHEKYRPRNLRDLISNDDSINLLYKLTKKTGLFNILICGQTDVGKKSAVFSFLNEIKMNEYKARLIEFDCISGYNIKDIIDILKNFLDSNLSKNNVKKLIVIQNGEFLTLQMQLCLREYLEKKNFNFSFWIICQSIFKINPAILSRCIYIYFKHPNLLQFAVRFKEILDKENSLTSLELLEYFIDVGNCNFIKKFNLIINDIFSSTIKTISSLYIDKKHLSKLKKLYLKDICLKDNKSVWLRKYFYFIKNHKKEKQSIFIKIKTWFYVNNPSFIFY